MSVRLRKRDGAGGGLLALAGTPRAIIMRINQELAAALNLTEVQERLVAVGAEAAHTSPEAYGKFLQQETLRGTRVLKQAGIKLSL